MQETRLDSWQTAATPPGRFLMPPPEAAVEWRDTSLPVHGSDGEDHWFRHDFVATGDSSVLRIGGIASVSDVYLDGVHVLHSDSMFLAHSLPIEAGSHELAICARALDPLLEVSRKPRARWRSSVPRHGSLRWFRTTLLGRAPGFAPGPPVVGPWRDVSVARESPLHVTLRPTVTGRNGMLEVGADAAVGPLEVDFDGRTTLLPEGGGAIHVTDPRRWWPHTHGDPHRYLVRVRASGRELERNVGFRDLETPDSFEDSRFQLVLNGTPIFARGVVWTPVPDAELRRTLETLRDAGLNFVRVVGTTVYAPPAFHDLCDQLGLMVWQDFMFANMDYPISDLGFRDLVEAEVRQALAEVAGRPSLVMLCGNSEVEQQVGMLGLDPSQGRGELFSALIPELIVEAGVDAGYVPSAPTGGDQPFQTNRGVANYFGVGAYLRPLEDVRRAAVPFASECLAFANVPDETPHDHAHGVMRDVGADWDFADVRDHYLRLLHGVGREADDYWERSRFVTGEVMAEVFGEWRRDASETSGGLILWARDLVPGAGWGLLDHRGNPKVALHHLARVLAPVAVWMTDEGLNGISVHVANDRAEALEVRLRVALYRGGETCVGEAVEELTLLPHSVLARGVEEILGRFVDVSYAYRFSEPQQDLVVATLERGEVVISQAVRFPVGRPRARERADQLGLVATASAGPDSIEVTLGSRRFVYGARLARSGFLPVEDAFNIEPGHSRTITMRSTSEHSGIGDGSVVVRALNLSGTLRVDLP